MRLSKILGEILRAGLCLSASALIWGSVIYLGDKAVLWIGHNLNIVIIFLAITPMVTLVLGTAWGLYHKGDTNATQ